MDLLPNELLFNISTFYCDNFCEVANFESINHHFFNVANSNQPSSNWNLWKHVAITSKHFAPNCFPSTQHPLNVRKLVNHLYSLACVKEFRVSAFGLPGAGRTTLLTRLSEGKFVQEIDPTMYDAGFLVTYFYKQKKVRLIITDVHPSCDFMARDMKEAIQSAFVCLIMCSAEDVGFIQFARQLHAQICTEKYPKDEKVIIVITKTDLSYQAYDESLMLQEKHFVHRDRVIKTSAKTGFNVNELLLKIVQLVEEGSETFTQQSENKGCLIT